MHAPPLDPSLKGKNVWVKFFDTDMSKEKIVSYDTYIHCQFTEIVDKSLDQDPSGEHLTKMFNPYLDAPSNGEQDSSSEEEKGHSLQLFTLPQDEDTIMEHWDGDKNDPDSYVYMWALPYNSTTKTL